MSTDCGSAAAAKRHRRAGIPDGTRLADICPECAEAERVYNCLAMRRWRARVGVERNEGETR